LDAEGDRLFGRPWVERARAEVEEELCLAELRHAEVLSQVEVAGCLEITQRAGSKLEHFEGSRVSTLRQHIEALGACLAFVAVFDDEDHRVRSTSPATTQPDRTRTR
jgi:hypothetical protein